MREEWYYFTFGYDQPHQGYYVKIKGDYGTARQKMCEKYGIKWAFQYSEEEWKEIEADPQRWWPMEKELEMIE